MTRYLLIHDGAADSASYFSTRSDFGAWGPPVELAAVRDNYDAILELTEPDAFCRVNPRAARIGFVIRSLAVLEEARRRDLPGDVLFVPSRLTALDAYAMARATLMAARELSAGHRLTAADLATEKNGRGLGEAFGARLVGRELAYDLKTGAPIDYGMVR